MQKIQTLWVEGELSNMEKVCLKSFLYHGHEVDLYTYGSVVGVPSGVNVMDGREILEQDKVFTHRKEGVGKDSVAGFSDHFRYELLNKKGGWWVDTDVVCLKPFKFNDDKVIATSYEHKWGECAITCVMKIPQNDPILEYCLSKIENINRREIEFGDIGPHLLQEAVQKLEAQNTLVEHNTFCPIGWRDTDQFVKPYLYRNLLNLKRSIEGRKKVLISEKSCAVHLWNQFWREENIDKDGSHPWSSVYERLKRKYKVN